MRRTEKIKWWLATQVDRLPGQCWSDLVMWAMRDRRDNKGAGFMARLPWAPIGESCRKDAEANGRCYCGRLASDGAELRPGQTVCVTRVPGGDGNRLCSRPSGHDGMHRCGGIEWGRA